jgi:hypothetical protein
VRFGNFSVMPRELLERIVGSPQLWNHYAAAVIRSRVPYIGVPTARATRLGGRSKMNWPALTVHGLSALAVFSDIIGARLLFGNALAGLGLAVGLVSIAVTGGSSWNVLVTWVPALLLLGSLSALAFTFTTLAGRQNATFVPLRDYPHFILDVKVSGAESQRVEPADL